MKETNEQLASGQATHGLIPSLVHSQQLSLPEIYGNLVDLMIGAVDTVSCHGNLVDLMMGAVDTVSCHGNLVDLMIGAVDTVSCHGNWST